MTPILLMAFFIVVPILLGTLMRVRHQLDAERVYNQTQIGVLNLLIEQLQAARPSPQKEPMTYACTDPECPDKDVPLQAPADTPTPTCNICYKKLTPYLNK